ncbi:A24 family peptidase [Paenibacillus sp. P96]|uniref:A24 family peptidase n=1 Tax=Paenibacillus zeirhizosphaerae TaxID=2987519 RepID=A0ABT9FVV2_9BACL|nr:A24 family peptidase [Paenibacillus sp. P96]MDP4098868.1 A24 family peptidase [Paenibacillus sp. P96]
MGIMYIGCAVFLAAALVTDLRSMKIPNKLTLPAVLSGLAVHGVSGGWEGLLFACAGLGTGFGLLLVMYWMGAVGAGDVKLFAGIGAWLGSVFVLQSAVYSVLFAGLIGLMIVLWKREALLRLRRMLFSIGGFLLFRSGSSLLAGRESQMRFPFMVAVIPGVISAYVYLSI